MQKRLISFAQFKKNCGDRVCHHPFHGTCTAKNCPRWARLEVPKPAPRQERQDTGIYYFRQCGHRFQLGFTSVPPPGSRV